MNRSIALVVRKVNIHESGTDFAYWQSLPYEARIAALEEIRRDYQTGTLSQHKDPADVQSGFQRVYRIVKR
jgi:hypothetical protein